MYALSMMLLIILGLEFSDQQRMDAFDDGFGGEGEVEVDPAAEFLAKEQEELGDIGQYPANYQASGFNDKQIIGEDLGLNSAGEQLVEGGEPIQAFKEEEVNCMFLYFYCAQSSFSSYSFLNSLPVSLHHAPTSFHNFQCFHWRHAWERNTFKLVSHQASLDIFGGGYQVIFWKALFSCGQGTLSLYLID